MNRRSSIPHLPLPGCIFTSLKYSLINPSGSTGSPCSSFSAFNKFIANSRTSGVRFAPRVEVEALELGAGVDGVDGVGEEEKEGTLTVSERSFPQFCLC